VPPPVRFLTTSDGVRVAYCAHGDGPPLVFVRGWISHVERSWQDPEFRAYFEPFTRHFTLVRYDMRGNGLSDKEPPSIKLGDAVTDLDAVIEALGIEQATLYGQCFGGPIAIAYAARHPYRVSRLILDGTYARGTDIASPKRREDLLAMLRNQPEAAMLMLAYMTDPTPGRPIALDQHYRDVQAGATRVSAEAMVRLYELGFTLDVSHLLPSLTMPTLVLHRRDNRSIPFGNGVDLASSIPNAHFVALPGAAANPWQGDARPALEAIGSFLGVKLEPAETPAVAEPPSGVVTILFTDMEQSTSTTQRMGDAAAHELVRAHNAIVREALASHDGREIKHTGDGIMASFASASQGVHCAVEIQRLLADYNQQHGADIHVRIGLNAGEPVVEGGDLFGTAVQLAARACAHASPGQILASNVVRELTAGKGILFRDLGEFVLRGFEDPARLYEVGWQE
jgi:class 3 adenylate cyclase